MLRLFSKIFIALLTSVSLTFGQSTNLAAVDTLTKDVAIAVFANINQPKAQDIYVKLLNCGNGCDPQTIIRVVGSWDQVGEKMQELSELKNTSRFMTLSPEEANVAVRKQLTQFYEKYKADKNYGVPLSPKIQAQILAKIDRILPPAVEPEPSPAASGSASDSAMGGADEPGINLATLQLSQLERQVKEAEEKQRWMMIISAIAGLLVGAGVVYLLAYRALKNEVYRLNDENRKLSQQNDSLRNKPINEPRQPQGDFQKKANAYDAILADLGTDNPIMAIQQLKQQAGMASVATAPIVRSGEPIVVESAPPVEPVQVQMVPVQVVEPVPTPARSEVFYFPPPDPGGQFDLSQKSDSLSPESAYRFSVSADTPSVASFRFEAEPGRVARFLTYRNYMIEPACDSENSYTTTHTRIATRQDGLAVLENGVWRVKTKALIRYE